MSELQSRGTYDRIRAARDARARASLIGEPDRCVGCGGEYRNVTAGCEQCWDRANRRKRRQDPVKHAHDLRIWREAKRRRAAAA